MDPARRDQNRKCAYHKEHDHKTKQCKSLHFLVEKLVRAGHLRQYVRSEDKNGESSRNPATTAPTASAPPSAMINYIHGGSLDEGYSSKRKWQRLLRAASVREQVSFIRPRLTSRSAQFVDGTITFPQVDPNWTVQPHRDALILTLGVSDFDVKRILVDPESSADLL